MRLPPNRNRAEPARQATGKSKLELTVDLMKALAWPVFGFFVLVSFWTPLQKTAALLPSLVERSDTISIAGLSLKIGSALKNQATPEVERVLAKLTVAGIEKTLALGGSSWWGKESVDTAKRDYAELVALGLVEEVAQAELDARNKNYLGSLGYGIKRTDLGEKTQVFLRSVVAQFVQELNGGKQAREKTRP